MSFLTNIEGFMETLFSSLPLEEPSWFLLVPIAAVILFLLLKKDFVKIYVDNVQRRQRTKTKVWVYFLRLFTVIFLTIALATPFAEVQEEARGNPEITLLVDESNSMDVLNTDFISELQSSLEARVPTTTRTIGTAEDSRLGDAILDNLESGKHVLLVSDGNIAAGTSMDDVAFFATSELNASISAIALEKKEDDASVYITGPDKVVAGTSNAYVVHITKTYEQPVPVRVVIDGITVFEQETNEDVLVFEKEFSLGTHKLEATVIDGDHFTQNNKFYKTVDVLEKPKILLLSTKSSPVEGILDELYTVQKQSTIPADLSEYYAIVANDVKASQFTNINGLHEFLLDEENGYYGGGLVVLGGFASYDRGGYKNAPIESMLPVTVGKGEQKKGDDNIVIILDISGGSTGVRYEQDCSGEGGCRWVEVHDEVSALDIIKAQAINLISNEKNIVANNKVAVIAFGAQGTLEETGKEDFHSGDTVKIIEPLDYLYNNQGRLKENIPRLVGGGPSEIGIALSAASDMLRNQPGQSNYILLLTDGNVGRDIQEVAKNRVKSLQGFGVQTFTYGVGRNEQNVMSPFLSELATIGDGLYEGPVFTTQEVNPARISIQWGDPDQKGFGDEFGLITFSLTHFITRDLDLTAQLNGFNQVAPKSSGKVLVTTDFGQPALTVMNYGNGRVAALTVFTGGGLGPLLNAENSILITRTVNWAIGDPQRKQDFFVDITDARLGEQTQASIRSEDTLNAQNVELIKDGNKYTAIFTPDTLGFSQFFGAEYATNYVHEYQEVGMSDALNATVQLTNGKLFSPQEVDAIVEHVTELSRQQVLQRKVVRWPFITLAVLAFLVEIFIRRMNQYKK